MVRTPQQELIHLNNTALSKITPEKELILIYVPLGFSNTKMSLLHQLRFIKNYENEFSIIFVQGTKGLTNIKEKQKLGIDYPTIFVGEIIENIYNNQKTRTFRDWVENEDPVFKFIKSKHLKVHKILNWGGIFISESLDKLNEMYNTTKNQTFLAKLKIFYMMFSIKNLIEKYPDEIEYIEMVLDPLCFRYSNEKAKENKYYHEHSIPGLYKRLDSFQYYYLSKDRDFEIENKMYNFTFGMSEVTALKEKDKKNNRGGFCKNVIKITRDEEHFFCKSNILKINTFISREEYNNLISKSKYTMIINTFHRSAFSITRFCDAIFYETCPLITDTCNLSVLENDYNIDIQKLEPIIFDITKIDKISDVYNRISENQRLEIIDYLYDKMFNPDNLQLTI